MLTKYGGPLRLRPVVGEVLRETLLTPQGANSYSIRCHIIITRPASTDKKQNGRCLLADSHFEKSRLAVLLFFLYFGYPLFRKTAALQPHVIIFLYLMGDLPIYNINLFIYIQSGRLAMSIQYRTQKWLHVIRLITAESFGSIFTVTESLAWLILHPKRSSNQQFGQTITQLELII